MTSLTICPSNGKPLNQSCFHVKPTKPYNTFHSTTQVNLHTGDKSNWNLRDIILFVCERNDLSKIYKQTGLPPMTVIFPHKGPVMRKVCPCHDVIMRWIKWQLYRRTSWRFTYNHITSVAVIFTVVIYITAIETNQISVQLVERKRSVESRLIMVT